MCCRILFRYVMAQWLEPYRLKWSVLTFQCAHQMCSSWKKKKLDLLLLHTIDQQTLWWFDGCTPSIQRKKEKKRERKELKIPPPKSPPFDLLPHPLKSLPVSKSGDQSRSSSRRSSSRRSSSLFFFTVDYLSLQRWVWRLNWFPQALFFFVFFIFYI